MIYLRSVLMGVAALIVALILFVAISLLPMVFPLGGDSGAGSIGMTLTIGPIFWIVAALVFAAGFWWEFRRASKRPRSG
jgi:hypothetical protein